MRPGLAIDATGWGNHRGEGRFLRGLLGALVDDPVPRPPGGGIALVVEGADAPALRERFGGRVRVLPLPARRRPGARLAAGEPRRGRELFAQLAAAHRSGCGLLLQPTAVGWFPAPGRRQLVVVHDLKPGSDLHGQFARRRDLLAASLKQRLALRSAAKVLTVSASTEAELLRSGIEGARIRRLRLPVERCFRPRGGAEVAAAREAVGLDAERRFLLVAAGLNRHKDPGLVVSALPQLDRGGGRGRDLDLVVVGEPRDAYDGIGEAVAARALALGLGGRVLLPGRVSDQVLAALYSGCEALVSASRFEGLGLTPLEARACGARLVLSDIPAHRETSADAAVFFEPGGRDELVAAIEQALAAPAPEPAARYSWSDCARTVAAAATEAVEAASGGEEDR